MSNDAQVTQSSRAIDLPSSSILERMIGALGEAARDTSIDISKMREIWAMQKEMLLLHGKQLFNAALSAAQADMSPIAADAVNPRTHSKYASAEALDLAIRPIYTRHGLALFFDTLPSDKPEVVLVSCRVSHSGGFEITSQVEMPADGKGAKGGDVMTKTHAVGAGITYGRRYIMGNVFNIAVAKDRDGNKTETPSERITAAQVKELEDLVKQITPAGTDPKAQMATYLNYLKRVLKCDSLAELRTQAFATAKAALTAKLPKRAA